MYKSCKCDRWLMKTYLDKRLKYRFFERFFSKVLKEKGIGMTEGTYINFFRLL